jgi:hypothetical protein
VVVGSRLYAMSQGTYEGTPAYVGAFLIGLESDNPAILVIAASVDGCRLLELARVQL